MKAFWTAFFAFGGVTLLVFVFFSISSGKSITELHPTAILGLVQIVLGTGLAAGCLFGVMSWIGRRSKERQQTDELMRQYLEKKMKEEEGKDE